MYLIYMLTGIHLIYMKQQIIFKPHKIGSHVPEYMNMALI